MTFSSFSRSDLERLAASGYMEKLIDQGKVSPDPEIAVLKICSIHGVAPNVDGSNIAAIGTLRQILLEEDQNGILQAASFITAPHTHWPQNTVIIEEFIASENRYAIGPNPLPGRAVPISFVFSPLGLEPYEFAGESVAIDRDELKHISPLFEKVNRRVIKDLDPNGSSTLGFGIGINHRFKKLFEKPSFSTMEYPDDEGQLSFVEMDSFSEKMASSNFGQIGWSSIGPPEGIAQEDIAIAKRLYKHISSLPPKEAKDVVAQLRASY